MTFLELVRTAYREARLPGKLPDSVMAASGLLSDVVAAVANAWHEIQMHHVESWRFMSAVASAELVAGQATYTLAELNIADSIQLTRVYSANGHLIKPVSPAAFASYQRAGASTGAPQLYSQLGEQQLGFAPTPMQSLYLDITYQRSPQILHSNLCEPRLPKAHVMIIVWKAVMDIAANESDTVIYQKALEKYELGLARLEHDQMPPLKLGRNLFI